MGAVTLLKSLETSCHCLFREVRTIETLLSELKGIYGWFNRSLFTLKGHNVVDILEEWLLGWNRWHRTKTRTLWRTQRTLTSSPWFVLSNPWYILDGLNFYGYKGNGRSYLVFMVISRTQSSWLSINEVLRAFIIRTQNLSSCSPLRT